MSGGRRLPEEGTVLFDVPPRLGAGVEVGSSGKPSAVRVYRCGAAPESAAGRQPPGRRRAAGASSATGFTCVRLSTISDGLSSKSEPLSSSRPGSSAPGRAPLAESSGKRSELLISSRGKCCAGARGGSRRSGRGTPGQRHREAATSGAALAAGSRLAVPPGSRHGAAGSQVWAAVGKARDRVRPASWVPSRRDPLSRSPSVVLFLGHGCRRHDTPKPGHAPLGPDCRLRRAAAQRPLPPGRPG